MRDSASLDVILLLYTDIFIVTIPISLFAIIFTLILILLYIIENERNSLKIIGCHPPPSVTSRDLISHLKTLSHLDEKPFLHSVQILHPSVLLD